MRRMNQDVAEGNRKYVIPFETPLTQCSPNSRHVCLMVVLICCLTFLFFFHEIVKIFYLFSKIVRAVGGARRATQRWRHAVLPAQFSGEGMHSSARMCVRVYGAGPGSSGEAVDSKYVTLSLLAVLQGRLVLTFRISSRCHCSSSRCECIPKSFFRCKKFNLNFPCGVSLGFIAASASTGLLCCSAS